MKSKKTKSAVADALQNSDNKIEQGTYKNTYLFVYNVSIL